MVDAFGQGQFGFHRPAVRAGLRAWIPPVDDMQPRAGACGLVFQLAAELAEVRVQYMLGKPPVMAHALHVEVLDADVGIIVGEPRGELADVVGSLGGYASVDSAHAPQRPVIPFRPVSVVRAPVAAAQRLLGAAEFPLRADVVAWIGERGAIRQGGEGPDTQIHADLTIMVLPFPVFRGNAFGGTFDGEGRIPEARMATDGHAHDSSAVDAFGGVLHAVHASDARQSQRLRVVLDKAEAAGRVCETRNTGAFRLVFRPAHPAARAPALPAVRPVPQRLGQPFERAAVRLLAVLPPPRGDFVLPLVPPAAHRVQRPVRFLAQGDLAPDVREHQIVRETRATRMGLQQPCLPWGRVETDSDGLIRAHRASPPTPSPHGVWPRGVRTAGRRTRSAPRSCRAPDRRRVPCRPPR